MPWTSLEETYDPEHLLGWTLSARDRGCRTSTKTLFWLAKAHCCSRYGCLWTSCCPCGKEGKGYLRSLLRGGSQNISLLALYVWLLLENSQNNFKTSGYPHDLLAAVAVSVPTSLLSHLSYSLQLQFLGKASCLRNTVVEKEQILSWLRRGDFCLTKLGCIKRYVRVDCMISTLENFLVEERQRNSHAITHCDE